MTDHPSPEALASLLEGEAGPETEAMREHLAQCRACRLALAAGADADEEPPFLGPGASVGRYVLLDAVGVGGMGIVYAAYDPTLDRRVALKVLLPSVTATQDDAQWIEHEARAMAQLSHPNVVTVYDVGQLGDRFYLSMEFVAGRPLDAWLSAKRRSTLDVVRVFAEAGRGLAAAHAAGVVHRDFKPSNVLVGEDGRVRVTDFGLALRPDLLTGPATAALAGTPKYLAPELTLGGEPTPTSDVYSFCLSLKEALPADALPPAVRRGLDEDPDRRSPDLTEILAALERRLAPRASKRRWWGGGLIVLFVVGTFAAWRVGAAAPCETEELDVPRAWDSAARARVREAFAAGPSAFADRAWTDVERRLDAYAKAWQGVDTQVCELERSGTPQADAALCLRHRRVRLQATVDVLAEGGDATIEHALSVLDALPDVESCLDRSGGGLDAEGAGEAYATLLGRTRALSEAERHEDAAAAARELVEVAERDGTAAQKSQAHREAGHALLLALRPEKAEASLQSAARFAIEAGDARAQARAWTQMIDAVGAGSGRDDEAKAMLRVAEAAVASLEDPIVDEARLFRMRASIAGRSGRFEECRTAFVEALSRTKKAFPDAPRRWLGDLDGVVACMIPQAKYAEAQPHAEEALAIAKEAYGEHHPTYAMALKNFGLALGWQRLPEGVDALRRAVAIYEASGSGRSERGIQARNNLASVLAFHGKPDEAIEQRRLVIESVDAVGIRPQKRVQAHLLLAIDLVKAKRFAEAEGPLAEARKRWKALPQADPFLDAGIRTYAAMVAEADGRIEPAINDYLAAKTIMSEIKEPGDPYPAWLTAKAGWLRGMPAGLGEIRKSLVLLEDVDDPWSVGEVKSMAARALHEEDPDRASELLSEARAALQLGLPQTRDALIELEAWAKTR